MADFVDIHTHFSGKGIRVVNTNEPEVGGMYSMGIHPLRVDRNQLCRIEYFAKRGMIAAIGEAGLDRNSSYSMEDQAEVFELQVEISERYGLPIIIHCVRAFSDLISIRKKLRAKQVWIIHGFNNNIQILNQLLAHGFYVSAGKKMLIEQSNIYRLVECIPRDRLFFETDDVLIPVSNIYQVAVPLLGMSMEDLKERVFMNYQTVFNGRR